MNGTGIELTPPPSSHFSPLIPPSPPGLHKYALEVMFLCRLPLLTSAPSSPSSPPSPQACTRTRLKCCLTSSSRAVPTWAGASRGAAAPSCRTTCCSIAAPAAAAGGVQHIRLQGMQQRQQREVGRGPLGASRQEGHWRRSGTGEEEEEEGSRQRAGAEAGQRQQLMQRRRAYRTRPYRTRRYRTRRYRTRPYRTRQYRTRP